MIKVIRFNINQYLRTTLHRIMTYLVLVYFIYVLYNIPRREKPPKILRSCFRKKNLIKQFLAKEKKGICFNPIQDGSFCGCWRMGGIKRPPPLPKIYHTYPATMKLGKVIPYLKMIQKIYESRDTSLEFCWHQHFFTGKQQILLYEEIQL